MFLKHRYEQGDLAIQTQYTEDAPNLRIDEKKIKQVLINLVMNARHAVGKNGWIHIRTEYDAAGEGVRIIITDNGYGIEAKHLKRIFDPFFTTKPTGEGTGLGLAVSYGIVKSHGGDIEVVSTPGRGTAFTVYLPINKPYYKP